MRDLPDIGRYASALMSSLYIGRDYGGVFQQFRDEQSLGNGMFDRGKPTQEKQFAIIPKHFVNLKTLARIKYFGVVRVAIVPADSQSSVTGMSPR